MRAAGRPRTEPVSGPSRSAVRADRDGSARGMFETWICVVLLRRQPGRTRCRTGRLLVRTRSRPACSASPCLYGGAAGDQRVCGRRRRRRRSDRLGWATEEGSVTCAGLERIGFEPERDQPVPHHALAHRPLLAGARGSPTARHAHQSRRRRAGDGRVARGGAEAARASSGAGRHPARAGAHDMIAMMHGVPDVGVELPDHWLEGNPRIVLRNRTLVAIPHPGAHERALLVLGSGGPLFFHRRPRPSPNHAVDRARDRGGPIAAGRLSRLAATGPTMPDAQLLPAHGPDAAERGHTCSAAHRSPSRPSGPHPRRRVVARGHGVRRRAPVCAGRDVTRGG